MEFFVLQRCLPMAQRKAMKVKGMDTKNVIWAFHSESEEELLNMIPCVAKGTPTWHELRELGVGWWVTNNTVLKRLFEKVAKASFQVSTAIKNKSQATDSCVMMHFFSRLRMTHWTQPFSTWP